jgi:hypothetical protein
MTGDPAVLSSRKRSGLLAITVGGLTAGALDLLQACILFGSRIPLVITPESIASQLL